jgi:ATP-dependent Clp protease ATP-binding subunit ClpA
MYERFTDRARKMMALANQEAWRLGHQQIATEHILLGLVKEGSGIGAYVIKSFNVDLRRVRSEVEKQIERRPMVAGAGKLPQTPSAKKVTEFAIEEARTLEHKHVGTEHMLLGLLKENQGVAYTALSIVGLSLDSVRARVAESAVLSQRNGDPDVVALRELLSIQRTENTPSEFGGAFDVRAVASGTMIIHRLVTRINLGMDDLTNSAQSRAATAMQMTADELEKKAAELRDSAEKLIA